MTINVLLLHADDMWCCHEMMIPLRLTYILASLISLTFALRLFVNAPLLQNFSRFRQSSSWSSHSQLPSWLPWSSPLNKLIGHLAFPRFILPGQANALTPTVNTSATLHHSPPKASHHGGVLVVVYNIVLRQGIRIRILSGLGNLMELSLLMLPTAMVSSQEIYLSIPTW